MNVIDLQTFKLKNLKKDATWLYSISYDELFSEFIETFNKFEKDPQNGDIHNWIDQVTDALNDRFYNRKTEEAKS